MKTLREYIDLIDNQQVEEGWFFKSPEEKAQKIRDESNKKKLETALIEPVYQNLINQINTKNLNFGSEELDPEMFDSTIRQVLIDLYGPDKAALIEKRYTNHLYSTIHVIILRKIVRFFDDKEKELRQQAKHLELDESEPLDPIQKIDRLFKNK
jgi:hypothetical protein